MALGLAAQRAVDDVAGVACDLRWPNDLLLNEKKLAGILVQTADSAVIAGIGVNVNQATFPEQLRSIATSLLLETGKEHSKEELLHRIVMEARRYAGLLADRGKGPILRQFEARSSYVRGKSVDVESDDRIVTGVTEGLDENGFLLVRTPDGVETIVAGGVRARS
jgi:BirA family biotin operon repressor/biotin-[acetyl-CoA-carboxylase] ligase